MYSEKYLKYKEKYFNFKNKLNNQNGGYEYQPGDTVILKQNKTPMDNTFILDINGKPIEYVINKKNITYDLLTNTFTGPQDLIQNVPENKIQIIKTYVQDEREFKEREERKKSKESEERKKSKESEERKKSKESEERKKSKESEERKESKESEELKDLTNQNGSYEYQPGDTVILKQNKTPMDNTFILDLNGNPIEYVINKKNVINKNITYDLLTNTLTGPVELIQNVPENKIQIIKTYVQDVREFTERKELKQKEIQQKVDREIHEQTHFDINNYINIKEFTRENIALNELIRINDKIYKITNIDYGSQFHPYTTITIQNLANRLDEQKVESSKLLNGENFSVKYQFPFQR